MPLAYSVQSRCRGWKPQEKSKPARRSSLVALDSNAKHIMRNHKTKAKNNMLSGPAKTKKEVLKSKLRFVNFQDVKRIEMWREQRCEESK